MNKINKMQNKRLRVRQHRKLKIIKMMPRKIDKIFS